jgi:rSAM/selenodomain-associated transferase 1
MTKQSERVLIVFVKNPIAGKVKTRLAHTIGNERALEVYLSLMSHTIAIGAMAECDRAVFFSDEIENDPVWVNEGYISKLQSGSDLGERMHNAFDWAFGAGYKKAVIIGSDCPELTTQIIHKAFSVLDEQRVVIGPATDGGYYLLGMKQLHSSVFRGKQWSTDNVTLDTILDLKRENHSYALLETLSDVDEEKDLVLMSKIISL